jgi:hypothetical protein
MFHKTIQALFALNKQVLLLSCSQHNWRKHLTAATLFIVFTPSFRISLF